ncbi:hypothetical protein CCACVL1_26082 [Corchorus capsularis]|uniref:DUF8204 domain-containing protein n=1 Tax=Corchorus capsularis TaxID=210143 RepID=A0A1R3GG07_COCAP|nr:hypothetical protein CCACVL1_26082 [Corchorus capsularis]
MKIEKRDHAKDIFITIRISNPKITTLVASAFPVRGYVAGKSEAEATKEGRSIIDFYYACAGYSVYMSGNKDSVNKEESKPQLPVCIGVELLVNRKSTTADTASAPAPVHSREDPEIRKPQTHKPTHAEGDDFLSRQATI